MTSPNAEAAGLAVRRAVRECLVDLDPGDLVLVACSGGADSLALAAATADVAPSLGIRAGAVVVDHGLQPTSDVIADQAAQHCRRWQLDPVELVKVKVDLDFSGIGVEAAARKARHEAFANSALHHGAFAVLLAHTLDDQAETVLIRLTRGSGARSLSGMAAKQGLLRRPLLELRRDVVRSTVNESLVWEDPHNADDAFMRARVRHRVLPTMTDALGDSVVLGLARTAESLRTDADALDLWTEQAWAMFATEESGSTQLGVDDLVTVPSAIRTRLLLKAAVAAGVPAGSITRAHVLAMDSFVDTWHGQGALSLPGGITANRSGGKIVLSRLDPPGSS